MRGKRLKRGFFTRDTICVAKDLLGKYIVRKLGKKEIAGKIIETEAYIGPKDRASHAFSGKVTPRNRAEYMEGGHIYIYLVYGMYWQLNISTSKAGRPECVLIRALEPIPQYKIKMRNSKFLNFANGPGKLCKWLRLDKSFYGENITKSKRIWIENPAISTWASSWKSVKPPQIGRSARIGIDYAGPYWSRRKWRFFIKSTDVNIKQ